MNTEKINLTWNGELKTRTSTDFLILHHAAAKNATIWDIQKWHKERGFIGVGYNFYISKIGVVFEGRPIWASDADAMGYNDNSLSICFEGDYDVETKMPLEQSEAGIDLIKKLLNLYPGIKVMRHKDVNSTSCPGKYFPDNIILEALKEPITIKPEDNFDGIIDVLASYNFTSSPDYWKQNALSGKVCNGDYVRKFITKIFENGRFGV